MINDITIIIRSVGERTEELCKKLILEQGVPEGNLFVIREKPFSKAMKTGYQKGIDNGLKWTYCIDADVLLAHKAIKQMLEIAEEQPNKVFTISGKCIDRFIPELRAVGNHLFRTSALAKLIENIAPFEDETIRPESFAKRKLFEEGYSELKADVMIGLHDFEQFYSDIYRKAFVHAYKHTVLIGSMAEHWKKNQQSDNDFKVALRGLADGLVWDQDLRIDANFFDINEISIPFEIEEKSITDSFLISSFDDIERIKTVNQIKQKEKSKTNYYQLVKLFSRKLKSDTVKILNKGFGIFRK